MTNAWTKIKFMNLSYLFTEVQCRHEPPPLSAAERPHFNLGEKKKKKTHLNVAQERFWQILMDDVYTQYC